MHIIENDILRVSINEMGAELSSLFFKPEQTEHIWQADKKWWGWHAPNLFPVIGKCAEDQILIDGKAFQMEKHGFARRSQFECVVKRHDELQFQLNANKETMAIFPYPFSFTITYKLHGHALTQTYHVANNGNTPMYCSVGAHPAFNVPFFPNESFEDYTVAFEKKETLERHHINHEGLFDGRKSVVSFNGQVHLHPSLFSDDALIFKDHQSRSLRITGRNHKQFVQVSFEDFPYLGIWTKEGAPYVCIEPWLGCADTTGKTTNFSQKEGIICLPPEEKFSAAFTIEISLG